MGAVGWDKCGNADVVAQVHACAAVAGTAARRRRRGQLLGPMEEGRSRLGAAVDGTGPGCDDGVLARACTASDHHSANQCGQLGIRQTGSAVG